MTVFAVIIILVHNFSPNFFNVYFSLNSHRFEQLVDDIEAKREQISVLDISLKGLTEQKEEIENQMKILERGLVEVLVEQQKKLFSILSSL